MEIEYIQTKAKLLAAGFHLDQIRDARSKYTGHRKLCRTGARQGEMRLTFEQWFEIWWSSGHWFDRGRGSGTYCMSRYSDKGHYELGNVFIQTNEQNVSDATIHVRDHIAELKAEIAGLKLRISELENQG